MKSTRFWIILLAAVLAASAAAAAFAYFRGAPGSLATVSQDGEALFTIDLSRVEEAYSFSVAGAVENTVLVEPGRICVSAATCPDQVCVRRGWISGGVTPIVCLPNGLVIQISGGSGDSVDAIAH